MKKIIFNLTLCFLILLSSQFLVLWSIHDENKYNEIFINNNDFIDNRVVLTLKNCYEVNNKDYTKLDFSEVDCETITEISYGLEQNDPNFNKTLVITLKEHSKENVLRAITILNDRNDVRSAELDYIFSLSSTDTLEVDDAQNSTWFLDKYNFDMCWNFTKGVNDVKVGVIDSGIDGTHPFLVSSINTNLSKDFVSETSNNSLIDEYNHGTHVAGIIASDYNEDVNTSGIAPNVSLVSLKVTTSRNVIISNVTAAINYAKSVNIDILNLSFGWYADDVDFTYLIDAISKYDGLIVCAAGNEDKDIDDELYYPACLDYDNIITISALDKDGYRWKEVDEIDGFENIYASNYGTNVDVYAPGAMIYSTVPGGYRFDSGSSMAAPFVTGLAGILMSINPNLTATEIKELILTNSDNHSMRFDSYDLFSTYSLNVKKINPLNTIKNMLLTCDVPEIELNNSANYQHEINDETSNLFRKNLFAKINVETSGLYDFIINSTSELDVCLFDDELNELNIDIYNMSNNTNEIHLISLSEGSYYIKAVCDDISNVDSISVSINSHTHNYTYKYLWSNKTMHKKLCRCNSFQNEVHAVLAGSNVCILCKGTADVGIIGGSGLMNVSGYRSTNGSYILKNGVIVLVQEDLEAYLEGTLDFYCDDSLLRKE